MSLDVLITVRVFHSRVVGRLGGVAGVGFDGVLLDEVKEVKLFHFQACQ